MSKMSNENDNNRHQAFPINLFEAIANHDLEGMIYLYAQGAKRSLQLLHGWNFGMQPSHDDLSRMNTSIPGE